MFKTINEALDWLTSRTRSAYGLADFKTFLASQDNPQFKLKTIHIAGTNGKGSTTNFLRSIFQCAGYLTGSFTSPHLEVHNDRIRINDRMIPDERLLAYVNEYYEQFVKYGLTMFEIDMFIACRYFLDEKVDYAMIEVGLGGQLDATNVINPLASVITTIDYDHMQYLGNTLDLIAQAKAGIIKPNKPCITHVSRPTALKVIKATCRKNNSKLYEVKPVSNVKVQEGITFDYLNYHQVYLSTQALYQCDNAATAIETIEVLKQQGIVISKQAVIDGLAKGKWAGRFEKIGSNPDIYLDGAHNEEGIKALSKTLKSLNKPCSIVFAALKDKKTDMMIERLLEITSDVTVTQFAFYRDKPAKELAGKYPVKIEEDWSKAVLTTIKKAKGIIVITGSLYFISIVRNYFKEQGLLV